MSSENYKLDNFPTLNEVFLVEDALQNADDSIITLQQLKKKLLVFNIDESMFFSPQFSEISLSFY